MQIVDLRFSIWAGRSGNRETGSPGNRARQGRRVRRGTRGYLTYVKRKPFLRSHLSTESCRNPRELEMSQLSTSLGRKFALLAMPVAFISLVGCQESAPASQTGGQGELSPVDRLLLASVKVALPPAGVTPADLPDPDSQGARLVTQYCIACHSLPSPASHSATDWPRYARRMWLRLDRLQDSLNLTVPATAERQVMLEYLIENSLQVASSLPSGPGRDFFRTTCTSCHDLPDPRVHSAEDWVAVVRRMMDHMQEIQRRSLTPEQYSRIVLYLETASGA